MGFRVKAFVGVLADAHATGTVNGASIDTAHFDEALIVLNAGTATATGTLDAKIQESADGSTGWADVTGAAFAQVAAANDLAVYIGRLDCESPRDQFFRVVFVVATDAVDAGAIVLLGAGHSSALDTALAFDVAAA